MKIAIDIRSLLDGRQSGVAEYTVRIVQALLRVAKQHEYHLFYNAARTVALPDFPGAHIHGLRYPNKVFNVLQWSSGWPRWDRLIGADVFFVPSFRLLPVSDHVPVVTTVHDLSFEHFPEFFSLRRRLWHAVMQPRRFVQMADKLIAVSAATARDLTDVYGVDPARIQIIHSGVSLDVPNAAAVAAVRRRLRLPDRFILFLGTLEPRKNIVSIIEAFSAIADTVPQELVIAGPAGWLTGDIGRAARRSAARERIHIIGYMAEPDKAAVYAAADLFVYPSFYEGFGFPPLEALLAGTPVITSYNSSLPEIVGEWATLIDPYNPGELAAVMQEVLEKPEQVPDEWRRQIRERYSWDTAARQTAVVIEGAAA